VSWRDHGLASSDFDNVAIDADIHQLDCLQTRLLWELQLVLRLHTFLPAFLRSHSLYRIQDYSTHEMTPERQGDPGMKRRWWHLIVALLMMTFQIMLCLRLQSGSPKLYFVFIPLWFVLVFFSADVLITLIVNMGPRSR